MKLWDSLYESFTSPVLQEENIDGYEIEHPTKNQFIVTKPTGEKYTVKKQASGNITCDCPAFRYNKTCKHVEMAKEKFPEEFAPRPRYPMSDMPLDLAHKVLDKYDPNWTLLGSGRRGKDTFKDIDILMNVSVEDFRRLAKELDANPDFETVVAGDDIFRGFLKGYELDINRVNEEKQDQGAMLLYRTGPADLNTFMRQVAMGIGGSLSEKGLVDHVTGKYIIPKGSSEEDYFKALGLPYLEPNKRENWRDYIDEEKYITEARAKQDEIVSKEKWIWDLAKDYQAAMEAGEFSNTDNYLRKYAKKYAVSPTSREMNYAYNIALKRIGGSYKHSPRSKQGKEDRANGLYASEDLGESSKLLDLIRNKLNEEDHENKAEDFTNATSTFDDMFLNGDFIRLNNGLVLTHKIQDDGSHTISVTNDNEDHYNAYSTDGEVWKIAFGRTVKDEKEGEPIEIAKYLAKLNESSLNESDVFNKYAIDVQDYLKHRFYEPEKCYILDNNIVVEWTWDGGPLRPEDKEYKIEEYSEMINQVLKDVEDDNGVDLGVKVIYDEVIDREDEKKTDFIFDIVEK